MALNSIALGWFKWYTFQTQKAAKISSKSDTEMLLKERPASRALTRTGGFLAGFTHTLQPYIGCQFGCSYCYVRQSNVHRFYNDGQEWGAYVYPRTGIAERLESELAGLQRRGALEQCAIFMSSSTDPYQGVEKSSLLSRGCLEELKRRPPGLLVIQTRAPLVARDFDIMASLGDRILLNITIETDREDVRRSLTPRCPSIRQRFRTAHMAREQGIPTQVTVSPCLPFSTVESFGQQLLAVTDNVIVDTFVDGDGGGGKRTARTRIPDLYAQSDWPNWRSREAATALYDWLRERIGERASWSQEGFNRQACRVTASRK